MRSLLPTYFENKKEIQNLRSQSIEKSKRVLENAVLPYLGDVKLVELDDRKLTRWRTEINKRDVKDITKNNYFKKFHTLLNFAVEQGLLQANPLKAKYRVKENDYDNKGHKYYSVDEVKKLLAVADKSCKEDINNTYKNTVRIFIYLIALTGMRRGETFGLKWSDFKNGNTIEIHRSIHYEKGKIVEGATKEKNSVRKIAISKELATLLTEHKEYQKSRLPNMNDEYYICGGMIPLKPSTQQNYLNKWETEAGLEHLKAHGFRHTYITLSIHNGFDIKSVADTAGNTAQTIMKHYLHSDEEVNKKCATTFQDQILG